MRLSLFAAMTLALAACAPAAPVALTPVEVPAALLALAAKPDRTVHIEWTGSTSDAAGPAQQFSAKFDLAGPDYAGSITSAAANFGKPIPDTTIELASVNGLAYERGQGESTWQQLPNAPTAIDPLRGLAPADIEYVGTEVRDGQDTHHLRIHNFSAVADAINPGLFFGSDTMGEAIDESSSTFDVWTDTAGQPIEAAVDVKPGAVVFGGAELTANYRFSNWNAEIYIVPPNNTSEIPPPPAKP
jgi:hypothetical protein